MASSDTTALMLQIDKADAGTTTCRPRIDAGATACRRLASTTIYGRHTGQKNGPDPSRNQIYDREVPSDQDQLEGVLRGNPGLDNMVQGPPGSTIGAWMCRYANGNRGRRSEGKPRRFRSRNRRPGPTTQSATSLGFIGHFMKGSRVRYCEYGRVSQRGMS